LDAATAKRMKIDPYCHRQRCKQLNVLFLRSFAVDFFARGLRTPTAVARLP